MVIRFRDCVLDRDARALVRRGRPVHLTPKAFDVLALLVSERPRALKKVEILDRVWPGTFVTDASLTRTIHEIREAIGDESSTTIRTVHGHGYAFAAEVAGRHAQFSGHSGPVHRLPCRRLVAQSESTRFLCATAW